MTPPLSRRAFVKVGLVLTVIAFAQTVLLAAGSATLSVSTTVARSCTINSKPLDALSTQLQLACSRGAVTRVLVDTTLAETASGSSRETLDTRVPTTDGRSVQPRVVTVNF